MDGVLWATKGTLKGFYPIQYYPIYKYFYSTRPVGELHTCIEITA